MRQLTSKQKKLLEKTLHHNQGLINNWMDLPEEIWNELEEINNTEILTQEVDRFIHDNKHNGT